MSAFVVSKDHIDAILTFAVKERMSVVLVKNRNFVAIADHLNLVGEVLWKENHKSVNHRYGTKSRMPTYTFEKYTKRDISLAVFVNIINCLSYQSCEHEGWENSLAHKILISLIDQGARLMPGCADGPWAI